LAGEKDRNPSSGAGSGADAQSPGKQGKVRRQEELMHLSPRWWSSQEDESIIEVATMACCECNVAFLMPMKRYSQLNNYLL
jgi:hypothetical protein